MKNLMFYLFFIALCGVSVFFSFKLTDSFWLTALIFVVIGVILVPLMCDGYFYPEEICFFFSMIVMGSPFIAVLIKHAMQ